MNFLKPFFMALCWVLFTGLPLIAFSQTKVVVIPLGADDPNECFILGKAADCVADGKVSVPVGLEFRCDIDSSEIQDIDYKQAFQFVELSFTASTGELIEIELMDIGNQQILLQIVQQPGNRVLLSGETGGNTTMPMEICEIPPEETSAPFIVGDFAWDVTAALSKTDSTVTVDRLVFTRTVVPIGPFVADGISDEAVFISVDTDNDTFSARVGDTNSPFANDGIKIEFTNFGEASLFSIGNIWDSVSNTGPFIIPGFPPGGEFISTLVKGGATYELRALIGESTSATITVDELTVTRQ